MVKKQIVVDLSTHIVNAGDVLSGTLCLIGIDPSAVEELTLQLRSHGSLMDPQPIEIKDGAKSTEFEVSVPHDILPASIQHNLGSAVFQLYFCARMKGRLHQNINCQRYVTVKSYGMIKDGQPASAPTKEEVSNASSKLTSIGSVESHNSSSTGHVRKGTLASLLKQLFCCCGSAAEVEEAKAVEPPKMRLPPSGARMGFHTAYNVFVFPEFCKFDRQDPDLEVGKSPSARLMEI